MKHSEERINYNWICKDQPQSGLPVLNKNTLNNRSTLSCNPQIPERLYSPVCGMEKGHSIIDCNNNQLLPTVNEIKESISDIDNCFIESTAQYKNIYIQLAKRYTQCINDNKNCEKILDDDSLVRRILSIAICKIEDIEKRRDTRPVHRETIKAIGELASQYIDLALQNNKTGKLLELFNEALNRILRSNEPEITKTTVCRRPVPKCILEHLEAVSDSSSSSSSQRNSERKVFHLTDWSGDDNTYNKEKGLDSTGYGWVWSGKNNETDNSSS